ncbi:MAG: hypothetical protein ACI4VF_07460 [Lachnospirales bacterium]
MIELSEINRSEALRYMGYNNNMDIENILPIIDECEKKLLNAIKPRFIYKVCDINVKEDCIELKNSPIKFHSNDILCHLEGCSKAVFLACTLSSGADRLISEYQVKDMSKAIIADCMASAAIEQVCDICEVDIKKHIGSFYMTWRFSPGYGDLSIEYQKDFIAITDAERKIGLTLNSGNILIPRKSVTAIIGLSENPIPKKRQGCAICNMNKTCQYRKRGEHCGF